MSISRTRISDKEKTAMENRDSARPSGALEPVATAHRVSSARPQKRDSAMYYFVWTGQNSDRSKGFVITSLNTSTCGIFRWRRGSGEIRHLKMKITSWRSGTKIRNLKLPEEPSWCSRTVDNQKRYTKGGHMRLEAPRDHHTSALGLRREPL